MSLSGEIGDVQVADVLQFIHLGGRSGTLAIEAPLGCAEIGFYRGQVVSARTSGAERLGEMLVQSGALGASALEEALSRQAIEMPRRPLGQLLVAMGLVTTEALYRALAAHISRTVQDVVTWERGKFRFDADDVRLIDELAVSPAELLEHVDVNTQMIVLEALRLFDERARPAAGRPLASLPPVASLPAAGGAGASGAAAMGAAPSTLRPRLQIVSSDRELVVRLERELAADCRAVVRVAGRDAGAPPPGEAPPLVLMDLRPGRVPLAALAGVTQTRPRAPVCALVADGSVAAAAYAAGARAVVVAELDALVACVKTLARQHVASAQEEAIAQGVRAGFARLKRVLTDLRAGLLSATMSLQLLSIISESVDRAVFMLVRRDELVALGAFGCGGDGAQLARSTQGLVMARPEQGLLCDALALGQPRSACFDDAALPDRLVARLGRPATGQAVAFPVVGRQRAIAVIYTDNGRHQRLIDEIDVLELATAQVGMAFENELLLRRRAAGP
jgi:hypothetical protein